MTTMASQITSLTVVYSIVYSHANQRKHQSSASLAFVWGIHRDRWIPRTKGQLRGKCFHLMTSSWWEILWWSGGTYIYLYLLFISIQLPGFVIARSSLIPYCIMMTSSNGNIFRVTGHLCGEFTSHRRWILRTKAIDVELWYFLWSVPEYSFDWVNNREAGDLRRHRAHYDVTATRTIEQRSYLEVIKCVPYLILMDEVNDVTRIKEKSTVLYWHIYQHLSNSREL